MSPMCMSTASIIRKHKQIEAMDTDKISLANKLIQLSLVPELITDIDTQQIEAAHFEQFKEILDEKLNLLFDLIQLYENDLFEKTAATQIFLMLQQNITNLTEKWFRVVVDERCLLELVLQHYKALIKVNVWKKNIGAIFGFHRFCQLYYRSTSLLQMSEVFFVLATGTLLLEHYEPKYKQLGIDLYNILMAFSNKSDLISANIHHAVYATCSANIPKIQDHQISLKLWKCLHRCLELDDSWKRTSDWHKVDELMIDLLKRIAFEGNISRSTILFHFAAKFGTLPYRSSIVNDLNKWLDEGGMERRSMVDIDWRALRSEYRNIDSFIIYKWVKKMLLLISNQNMFYGDDYDVACNLQAIHVTYIVWIFSIPLTLISSPVLDMLTKFVPTLLDCYRRYETKELVAIEIRQLFNTFQEHFQFGDVSSDSKNVGLAKRLETLLVIKGSIL
ncbi:uncharacterized protein LOC119070059 isoform X2 [Bradysia coprophila]|uniref:uncharacterized protein LOC119070059 isoform X2 n=1 Tax=Bradysia coprophila TaxID=38358 RepID=UPI00187D729F|nr:uncharacterized protein LOC119070059 isoform X2 [Bradysia coprophila]